MTHEDIVISAINLPQPDSTRLTPTNLEKFITIYQPSDMVAGFNFRERLVQVLNDSVDILPSPK